MFSIGCVVCLISDSLCKNRMVVLRLADEDAINDIGEYIKNCVQCGWMDKNNSFVKEWIPETALKLA